MTLITDTRPAFTDGLTLGGEDLALLLDYLRDQQRRLRLGYHSAGIVAGLKLRPEVDVLGQASWVLTPGIAIDGYGQMILSKTSVALDPIDLAGLPPGPVPVWVGYAEAPRKGIRRGFEVCDDDAFARIDEGFDLFFGRMPNLSDHRDGIEVNGQMLGDARLVARAIGNPAEPVLCDASVPYQEFPDPDDRLRWLIPLGQVGWDGAQFQPLDEALGQPQAARALRRPAGVIAETIHASEGFIRLARRESRAVAPGETVDAVCAESAPLATDFAADPLDPGAFVPEELVWIEGHVRARGDVRLWGTELSFRNADGSETSSSGQFVPMGLRRSSADVLTADTQDLELTLGTEAQTDVANRLLVGRRADDGSHVPVAALTGLGRMGLGTADPGRYLPEANSLVIEGDGAAGMTIRGSSVSQIHFAQGDGVAAQTAGRLHYDHGSSSFSWRTGNVDRMWLDGGGRLGVGLDDMDGVSSAADDLVVFREGSAGISVVSGADEGDANANDWIGRIAFGRGLNGGSPEAGAILYNHGNDRMQFKTDSGVRVTIDADGDLGIGLTNPGTRLHIAGGAALDDLGSGAGSATIGSTGGEHLKLGETGLQALRGTNQEDQLQLQPLGGGVRVHGLVSSSTRVVINEDGEMGLGTEAPSARLEVRGRVRMGATGQQYALAGVAGDLAVRGSVTSAGTVSGGAGFGVVRTQTGRYTVTFATAFSQMPSVVVTPEDSVGSGDNIAVLTAVRLNGFDLRIVDLSDLIQQVGGGSGAPASTDENAPFHFIAMGPSNLLE